MRLYRVTFLAGLAAGYVLGTRAGRERYDQLRKVVRTVADHPAVQQAAGALQAQATGTMKSAWTTAASGCRQGASKVSKRRSASSQSDQTGFADPEAPGNGFVPRPADEDQRPFVPVNGEFGSHDLT